MGYFSNGAQGMDYEAQYCDHCIHQDDPCVIWGLHLIHNYDECNNKKSLLHSLIPMDKKGWNMECLMFKPKKEIDRDVENSKLSQKKNAIS